MIYVAAVLIAMISPTFWLADLLKQDMNKAKVIRSLNNVYFSISVLSITIIIVLDNLFGIALTISSETEFGLFFIWITFLLSRCSEIFYAFLRDAHDKVSGRKSKDRKVIWSKFIINCKNKISRREYLSNLVNGDELKNHDRLALSFKSYFELIFNFSILYFLTPPSFWNEFGIPHDIIESMYFSGVTITTLGYGDITPKHWYPQFLTVFEVLCGFSLIVVCFAVYLRNDNES